MDLLVNFIFGTGTPCLILLGMLYTSEYVGAAAIMHALKVLGFGVSVIGGVFSLVGIGALSFITADISTKELTKEVLKKYLMEGTSKDELISTINSLPVSDSFKAFCRDYIRDYEFVRSPMVSSIINTALTNLYEEAKKTGDFSAYNIACEFYEFELNPMEELIPVITTICEFK